MNSIEVLCNCGKMKGWVNEGEISKPCPACGRRYEIALNKKTNCMEAMEVKV